MYDGCMSAPPNPPPILEYATYLERRVPGYLVVILYVWAVLDVLSGAFLAFVGFALIRYDEGDPVGFVPLFVGPMLCLWGGVTFWLACRMRQDQVKALRRAARLAFVAEAFAWVWAGVIGVYIINDLGGVKLKLFFVGVAVGVSATRMLLRRAVRRMR